MVYSREFDAQPRGWYLDEVAPRYDVRVSVSEVASPCETGRDVYLRRVAGVAVGDSPALSIGRLVHESFMLPFRREWGNYLEVREEWLRRMEELGVDEDSLRVYEKVLEAGYLYSRRAREEGVPVRVEPVIPGDALGLTNVKPDLLAGYTPVEIVVASNGGGWLWRKRLALAGYALAVEAWFRSPVDWGVVVGVKLSGGDVRLEWRLVKVTTRLRREFLERRD